MKNPKDLNREAWNIRAKKHLDTTFYDMSAFKSGASSLKEIELGLLPDLSGLKVLHLQCHFGQDSLSLARMGAQVTAVDFSEEAIAIAKVLSKEMDLPVHFICSDIMVPDLLQGETFDLIFMSYGVLTWHEDLSPLAELIERCLAPDGRVLLVEFHPHMQMYNDSNTVIEHSYFMDGPIEGFQVGSYATEGDKDPIPYVVWNHSLGEVLNTLIGAGLILEFVQEYDFSPYPCFENLVQVDEERWMVEGLEGKIPMCFAVRARKAD